MAQVPYSPVPSAQPAGPAGQYENIQASPASFGGLPAQATEKLGATEEQVGSQFAQTALQQQDLNNQADARQALSQYTPAMAKAWSQYGTLQGKAASDALPGFLQNLQDIQTNYAGTLQSPRARNSFMEASSYLTNRLSLMSSEHAAQQQKAYWVQQAQANQLNMGTTAALFMNDPETIATTVNSVEHSAIQEAQLQNLSPERTQQIVSQAIGKHVSDLVATQAVSNPDLALATFNRFKDQMDGVSIMRTTEHLRPILRNRQGDADLSGLLGNQGGGSGAGTPGANPAVIQQIKSSAAAEGVPEDQALTIAHIESHTGTVSDRPGSQYRGVFQLGDNERASVGLSDNADQTAQAQGGVKFLAGAYKRASDAVGHPADGWQTYMVHQQGAGAGPALLKASPDDSALDVLRQAGSRDPVNALSQNGGSPGMTVGQFLNVWQKKYSEAAGTVGARAAPGTLTGGLSPGQTEMPDWSALRSRAIENWGDEPERLTTVLSKLGQTQTRMEAATAAQRRILTHGQAGTEQALLDGLPVAIPEQEYRQSFPPDEADRLLTQLHVSKTAGEVLSGIRWGSAAQVQQAQNDLTSGMGTFSDQIRTKVGALKSAATVTSPGLPGQEGDVVETAEAYGLRRQIADKAVAQIKLRSESLGKDPANYVVTEPTVAAAAAAIDPKDPQSVSNYVNTTLGVQDHLGVPAQQQHVLSTHQAQSTVAGLSAPGVDAGQQLAGLQKQWGDAWPKVYGDLTTLGKLPAPYQVLSMIPSAVTRNDFQDMLKMATEHGGIPKLHDLATKPNMTTINDGLDSGSGAFQDFARTANVPGIYNNLQGIEAVKDGIRNLAAYYSVTGKGGGAAGLTKAINGVLTDKYDFDGYLRAPKGQLAPIEKYGDAVKQNLTMDSLAPVQGRDVGIATQGEPVFTVGKPEGLMSGGNIDLNARPQVKNQDGSVSTVRSMSFNQDGQEVLVPTVVGNRVVSDEEAIAHYQRTGENLGKFDTPEHATAYAQQLHEQQAQGLAINQRVQTDIGRPTQEQGARDALQEVLRTGKWVTNENDSGAFLIAQDRNGVMYRVKDRDGNRVGYSFKDAISGPPPADTTGRALSETQMRVAPGL